MKPTIILFDLYNTLLFVSNRKRPYQFLIKFLVENQVDKSEIRRNLLTQDSSNLLNFIQKNWNIKESNELLKIINQTEKLLAIEIASIQLFEETKEVLSTLKKEANLVLISNLASPYKKAVYDNELHHYFDKLIFSCDVGFQKPQIEIFELAIENIPKSSILMVGDSLKDDKLGAERIGINHKIINRNQKKIGNIQNLRELIIK